MNWMFKFFHVLLLAGGIFVAIYICKNIVPQFLFKFRRARRVKRFDENLADALQHIASSLKSGLTLNRSIVTCVEICDSVVAEEFKVALKEYHLGLSIEESLDGIRQRMPTPSANIAIGAMIVSSRLGGKLTAALQQIAKTIRERQRVEGRLKALTAQGRAQAMILICAPPVLGMGMYYCDTARFSLFFTTFIGQILFGGAIVLEIVGIYVTKRVMRLEV